MCLDSVKIGMARGDTHYSLVNVKDSSNESCCLKKMKTGMDQSAFTG